MADQDDPQQSQPQKSPGQDLGDTLKNVPNNVVDTLTLGPQRRAIGKFIDDAEDTAKNWWESQTTPNKTPQKRMPRKR